MKPSKPAAGAALITLLLLSLSLVDAKETFLRSEDFAASADHVEGGYTHAGLFATGTHRWAYYLIPEELRNPSVEDALADPSRWVPLNGFINREVQANFVLHDFRVEQKGVSLTWNQNANHPKTPLAKAWLVAVFTASEAGTYSVEGEMYWQNTLPARVTSGGLQVAKITGTPFQTKLLFTAKLTAPGAMDEPAPVPGFSDAPMLRNIPLEQGEKLAFIWHSDHANYRRIEGLDEKIQIVREEGTSRELSIEERQEAVVLQRFFHLLDLTGEEHAAMRQQMAVGDYRSAVRAYMELLAARAARLPGVRPFSYWLYGIADANRLLAGDLDFSRYGDMATHLTVHIGRPGEISFFRTAGDYATSLRDISTMHWATKHAEAYAKTGDPKFLQAWLRTWDDFFENWDTQYSTVRKSPLQMGLDPEVVAGVRGMDWLNAQLYLAWRLEAFYQGLAAVLTKAKEENAFHAIDEVQLARLLSAVTAKDAKRARSWLGRADKLVPNQIRHLGRALFQLGVFLPEIRESAWWRDEALPLYSLTHLPDGADREQSLNYFDNSLPALLEFLALLPPSPEKEKLVEDVGRRDLARSRFLPSLTRPDGILPSVGKNNHWRQYGKTFPLSPPSHAFTSIFFPYGGYAVMRDGWQPDSHYLLFKTSRPAIGHWRSQEGGLQLSAFGRNLLISSVGELYDSREASMGWSMYWYSAVGQNTILVDGLSPVMRRWEALPPDHGVWHTSTQYDVAETRIDSGYGGEDVFSNRPGVKLDPPSTDPKITDTTHHRRVIFLRKLRAWIVVDTVESLSKRSITQTWNFGPEYKENELVLDGANHRIETSQANAVNLAIYQFSSSPLNYKKYYGVYGEEGIFGWVGILKDREARTYTPATDVHTSWQNTGRQTVVSLLIPRPAEKASDFEIQNVSKEGVTGFNLTSPEGHEVAFRQASTAQPMSISGVTAEAESLLVELTPDGVKTGIAFGAKTFNEHSTTSPDFEFLSPPASDRPRHQRKNKIESYSTISISAPDTFEWLDTPDGVRPSVHDHRSTAGPSLY